MIMLAKLNKMGYQIKDTAFLLYSQLGTGMHGGSAAYTSSSHNAGSDDGFVKYR